jgi:hypothetical protein
MIIPNGSNNVFIDGGKTETASTVTDTIGYAGGDDLTIDTGDTLISPRADIHGTATINGLFEVTGRFSWLIFYQQSARAVGSGTIHLSGASMGAPAGVTLTIEPGLFIRCTNGGGLGKCINRSTISATDTATSRLTGIRNEGIIEALGGGHLSLSAVENYGSILVTNHSSVRLSRITGAQVAESINRGVIHVSSGGKLELYRGENAAGALISVNQGTVLIQDTPWVNDGIMNLRDSRLWILSNINTPALGTISRAGQVITEVGAILNNIGSELHVDGPADHWLINGTVKGGSITVSGGGRLTSGFGVFDGVAINGTVSMTALAPPNPILSQLRVKNGLRLDGTVHVGTIPVAPASLIFTGEAAQSLTGNAQVVLGEAGTDEVTIKREYLFIPNDPPVPLPVGDVTLGASVMLHGKQGSIGVGADARFFNDGTIHADISGGSFTIANLTNRGRIEAAAETTINIATAFAQTNGRLHVDGTLASAGELALQGGEISGNGTVDVLSLALQGDSSLAPGGDDGALIGTLTVMGDVSMAGEARLSVQLGLVSSDQLQLLGSLDLTGSEDFLDIREIEAIAIGSTRMIATYDGLLQGVFDRVTPGFAVSYETSNEIWVTKVPAPLSSHSAALAFLFYCMAMRWRTTLLPSA